MPSERRSKEQTWKEDELKQSLKEINAERGQGKPRRDKYGDESKVAKESSHSQRKVDERDRKDRGDERRDHDRRRDREEDRHRRSDKSDSDKKRRSERDGDYKDDKERRHKDGERERRHRDDDKERRHRDDEKERRHRDDERERRHRDGEKERRHKDDERKHKDDERKHRDTKGDRERRRGGDDRRDKHKDEDRSHRSDDKERRHRDESDREKRHRDRDDRDRKHKDEKERRHHDDGDKQERRREEEKGRREKDRDRDHQDKDDKRRHDRGDRDKKDRDEHRDGRNRDDRDRRHKDDRDRKHMEESDREKRHKDGDRDRKHDGKNRRHEENSERRDEHRDRKDRQHKDGGSRDRKKGDGQESSERHRRHEEELVTNQIERKSAKGDKHSGTRRPDDGGAHKKGKAHQEEEDEIAFEPPSKSAVDTQNEDEYGGYDDDFEDYDDDFEDDDGDQDDSMIEQVNKMKSRAPKSSNSEMEALYDALNAENEKLLADSRSNFTDGSVTPDESHTSQRSPASKPRGFINFVAAKQRDMDQKVASKARKRCSELLNIIELDTVHMSLFDLPPVKEYDLYMSSFGRTNAQQAYVQTNEDNLERDTQTEDIECTSKWTQHPPEGATACGTTGEKGESDNESALKLDEGKLTSFLQRTCQVIERLLHEEDTKNLYKETSSSFTCSEASFNLVDVEVFKSRQVSRCHFSPTDSNIVLTMHTGPLQAVDRKLDKYGMIGVWNTNDPSQPQKVVASASMPTCCCFSPVKATLVFGGMRDGSLVAWDLREPPTMHHSYMCGKKDWLLRFPTYNTAGVLKYDNHNSPITALVPILTDNSKSLSQESGLGLSFQLASLDKNGIVNLWVVAEILETSMAGSESDLGLSPNGKIKLLKSSTVSLYNPAKNNDLSNLCSVDLKLNPSNHNHFYVGTDAGTIIHGTRFGTQKVSPRCYSGDDLTPCAVNSIDLHPFGHPLMLAGCEDGSLRLYHLSSESPIIVWKDSTKEAAIKRVLWSRSCSYILFVLDSNSCIHMWDLLRNDAEPMTSDSLCQNNLQVTDICLSEEHVHSRPKMVISYSNGTVAVHLLSGHVSNLQPGENDQFTRFIEHL